MLKRSGATLVELLVAITMAAVVLGAGSTLLVRQRRDSADASVRAGAESQLRAALGAVPSALQDLSPSAGDLTAGEARDTALQIRAVVASGVACDSAVAQVRLSASDTGMDRESSLATAPRIGDTVWWWSPAGVAWTGRRVTSVVSGTGVCARQGPATRLLLQLGFSAPDTVPRASPVRLTRQARYSFYRARDGTWQLGIAEWSDVLQHFAPPQPVAGPFTLFRPPDGRTGFRYFDATGAELPVGVQGVPAAAIARLRMTLIAPGRGPGASTLDRRDSVDVAFRHAP